MRIVKWLMRIVKWLYKIVVVLIILSNKVIKIVVKYE